MSKKSVVIKMPIRQAPGPEDSYEPLTPSGEARAAPASALADAATPQPVDSPSDQWVRRRQAPAMTPPPPAAPGGLLIDLAAERDVLEVAALSFLLPSALGWFWLRNFLTRTLGPSG